MGNPIPGQVRAVDPYSSYQSDNINILTRVVSTGEDVIIKHDTDDLDALLPGGIQSQTININAGYCIKDDVYIETDSLVMNVNDIDYYYSDPGGPFPENGYYYLVLHYEYVTSVTPPVARLMILTASQRSTIYDVSPEKFLFLKALEVIGYPTTPVVDQVYDYDPENPTVQRNIASNTLEGLTDVDSYAGNAARYLSVNATEDGTEWVDVAVGDVAANPDTLVLRDSDGDITGRQIDFTSGQLGKGLGDASVGPDLYLNSQGLIAADSTLHINYNGDGVSSGDIVFRTGGDTSAATERAKLTEAGDFSAVTFTEGGTTLSSKYLGISNNAVSATVLETSRSIGGVSFNGSAAIVPQTIQVVDESVDTICYVAYFNDPTGSMQPKTGTNLRFDSDTGALTATSFVGSLDGTANIASNVDPTPYNGGTEMYVTFLLDTEGTNQLRTNTGLKFKADTGILTSTIFNGTLDKTVTAGSDGDILTGSMASSDNFRLRIGGASDAGYVEIAVSDNGTEPVYVRQYSGASFATLVRTATILNASGDTTFPGNVTAYYSDTRLKTIQGNIENPLDKISTLNGFYYTSNDTAKSFGFDSKDVEVGVSAQEVQAILPQVVKPAPFDVGVDSKGNEFSLSGENYLTIQYEKLVPLLIESIKELNDKIKVLEDKLKD